MVYFDTNSLFIHNELNQDIKVLEDNKEFYKNEIKNDKIFIEKMEDSNEMERYAIEKMEDSNEMERYAREKYYLKKENEDIFIIEHQDSLNKKKNNE